ncbi:MAG TPA: cupin-like domain-containing protein [Bryobacteraceae bacterium]
MPETINFPYIVSGGALNWPVMPMVAFRELRRAYGEVRVAVRESDDGIAEAFKVRDLFSEPRTLMPLSKYIDLITQPSCGDGARPPYAGNISLQEGAAVSRRLAPIMHGCRFPDWIPPKPSDKYRLWIAAAGQRSAIHNDPYDNFNVQLAGRKYFMLLAPCQHRFLYPVFRHTGLWASPVDPRRPNLDAFPEFAKAEIYECELEPGDILFLPRFWWHFANATTPCINVNRWVFPDEGGCIWWHQQPEGRGMIDYEAMLGAIRTQFESLPPESQQLAKPQFEELQADVARFLNTPVS